jgi:hypothetical protein
MASSYSAAADKLPTTYIILLASGSLRSAMLRPNACAGAVTILSKPTLATRVAIRPTVKDRAGEAGAQARAANNSGM